MSKRKYILTVYDLATAKEDRYIIDEVRLAKAIASRLAGAPLKWYRCENATRAMSEKDMFTIARAW